MTTAPASIPFVRPRRLARPAARLVVFPHAGGSGSAFYPLTRELPDDWDLLLMDYPGRGKRHRETPLEDMADLVNRATGDVLDCADDTPLALFGHSLGAVVCFEVSRALAERDVPPLWTGVSGRAAPDCAETTARLTGDVSDEALLEQLSGMGGLPGRAAEVRGFRQRFLHLVRSDLRALAHYRLEPDREPMAVPLTAFGGDEDPYAPPHTLPGWARQTAGEYRRIIRPGGHFHFFGRNFPRFTQTLVHEIRRAARRRSADDAAESVSHVK